MSLMAQPATAQIGSADAFDPDATDGNVYTAAVQADSKVFVAGYFSSIGGYTLPNDFIRPLFSSKDWPVSVFSVLGEKANF